MDRGLITRNDLVEPHRHGPMLFELVDAPLDRVAVTVEGRIETPAVGPPARPRRLR